MGGGGGIFFMKFDYLHVSTTHQIFSKINILSLLCFEYTYRFINSKKNYLPVLISYINIVKYISDNRFELY